MKSRFKILLFVLSVFLMDACTDNYSNQDDNIELSSSDFFKQNISIFDARVRSVSNEQYVREMYLVNFSERAWDKTSIGFEGYLFEDNGSGNDLLANDGIYTSVEIFKHDTKIPFIQDELLRSVLDAPIVSPEFRKQTELAEFAFSYELSRNGQANAKTNGPVATLECDVEICSTGCIADWIWDGFGCVCVSNCRAKIGWE